MARFGVRNQGPFEVYRGSFTGIIDILQLDGSVAIWSWDCWAYANAVELDDKEEPSEPSARTVAPRKMTRRRRLGILVP